MSAQDKRQNSEAFGNPPRSALERLITAVSVQGANWAKVGGGGGPELTAQDWMAALSGSGDPIGEEVVAVRYLSENPRRLKRALHLWGMNRLIDRNDPLKISAKEHRNVSGLVVDQHTGHANLTRAGIMKHLGIGNSRYDTLRPHWVALVTRLVNGESTAIEHLRRRVRY